MAIYSLHLRSIGKTTHAPRTAGAHIRYITRPEARADLLAQRMPTERHAARRWLDREERQDRQNARIIDKITAALPRELDARQRRMLVAVFAERVTRGRASWLAAIHQSGEDAHNPHAHIVIRDRDPETGKRVTRLSHAARGIETSPQRHRGPQRQGDEREEENRPGASVPTSTVGLAFETASGKRPFIEAQMRPVFRPGILDSPFAAFQP